MLVTHDVEEAVTLADRVIVLEGGQISLEREINIARPRLRDSPAFATLATNCSGERPPLHDHQDLVF